MNREEMLKLDKEEIVDILFAIINQQAEKIAELEARLNQNSKNSSRPPSSDGFRKQPKSLRTSSGKKAGGQHGHEGRGLKLMGEPDEVITHTPKECANCPNTVSCCAERKICDTRYEVDIVIKTSTTAHQITRVLCPMSNVVLTGSFPENITGTMQYGVNLEALAVSLNTVGMVSVNRTHEILSGVFGVPISTGTVSAMVSDCVQAVAGTVAEIKAALKAEPLINVDETGTRVDKQTVWAHTASTPDLTYIEIHESRGKTGMDAIGILLVFLGTVIHDCWAPYFNYNTVRHGLCNAHLLRELTAVWENTKQKWAQELIELLLEIKGVKEKLSEENSIQNPLLYYLEHLEKFKSAYDKILAEALLENPVPMREEGQRGKLKRGKTGALIDRLILHKDKYLLFFTDFSVPFDNNQAERDIRMFKVKQKVSGCFRTMQGAKDFAAVTSFVSTAKKRGIPGFQAIKDALMENPFSVNPCVATE